MTLVLLTAEWKETIHLLSLNKMDVHVINVQVINDIEYNVIRLHCI